MKLLYPLLLVILLGCSAGLLVSGCSKDKEPDELVYRDAVPDSVYLHKRDIEVITENLKEQSKNTELVFGFVGGIITILLGVQISINRSNSKSFNDIGAILAGVRQEQKDREKQCNMIHNNIGEFKADHETRIRTIEQKKRS